MNHHLNTSPTQASTTQGITITPLHESDYEDWARSFRAYVDFYKSSIPVPQYRKTFERIIDPGKDLYGLALRDDGKLVGIAHFYPHQTPWSEKMIMHFNGTWVLVAVVVLLHHVHKTADWVVLTKICAPR